MRRGVVEEKNKIGSKFSLFQQDMNHMALLNIHRHLEDTDFDRSKGGTAQEAVGGGAEHRGCSRRVNAVHLFFLDLQQAVCMCSAYVQNSMSYRSSFTGAAMDCSCHGEEYIFYNVKLVRTMQQEG